MNDQHLENIMSQAKQLKQEMSSLDKRQQHEVFTQVYQGITVTVNNAGLVIELLLPTAIEKAPSKLHIETITSAINHTQQYANDQKQQALINMMKNLHKTS
ncbi:MAG: hypothetical protein VXY77_00870 [Pseudomonadota bacterium]|nr:hypothetical protein [Pseudomonadota bacterium]